jgi:transposase
MAIFCLVTTLHKEIAMSQLAPRLNSKFPLDKTQPIFMGIDVHKKTLSISLVHQSILVGQFSISYDTEVLKNLLKRYAEFKIFSVYEAGFSGYHLHFFLESINIHSIITPPNKMPVVIGDRVKTDKKDSRMLAVLLSKEMLKNIHIPNEEQLNNRLFLRTREQLKRKRVSTINQIKLLLLQFNIKEFKTGLRFSDLEKIKNMPIADEVKSNIEVQFKILELMTSQISFLEEQTISKIKDDKRKIYDLLLSIPGMGKITAATLLWEIGDWNRFDNKKKIAAYLGLTPREYSSGESIKRGRITGQGNQQIRSLLIECAWILIRKDPAMELVFKRLMGQTKNKKKAIVGIARKLIVRIHAMIMRNEKYQIGLIF